MTVAVSVIVVNLNRRELLEKCLLSLWKQTHPDYEVIVVDNGSEDGSPAFLRSVEQPRLKVVELRKNLGFAGGCNAGIAVASGRYIATLNNDAVVDERWLEELVRAVSQDSQIGMCASKILFDGDRRRIDKVGHLIYLDGLNHGRGSGEADREQYEEPEDVLFPDGAAALYRREMFDAIGLFDERFFAYGDDADLGLRGRLAGWRAVYVPTAIAYHVHSATTGEFSSLKAFLVERNRLWVAAKNFPMPLLLVSPLFTVARLACHAYGSIRGIGSSGKFAAACSKRGLVLAIARAYWSGCKGLPQMFRARRGIRAFTRVSARDFTALLLKHRITLRALTLGS